MSLKAKKVSEALVGGLRIRTLELVKMRAKRLHPVFIQYDEAMAECRAAISGDRAAAYSAARKELVRMRRDAVGLFGGSRRSFGPYRAPRTAERIARYGWEIATLDACHAVRSAACLLGSV